MRVSCKCGVGKHLRGATPHRLHTTVYDARSVERYTGKTLLTHRLQALSSQEIGMPYLLARGLSPKNEKPTGEVLKGHSAGRIGKSIC